MTRPKFFTRKFQESALFFLMFAFAVIISPILAAPFAPLFDWLGYGQLRALYTEIFTGFFWGIEGILLGVFSKRIHSRFAVREESAEESSQNETAEKNEEIKSKEKLPLLPLRNVYILGGICAACVLLMSIVIGFKVKPFYDLGEKFTGFQMWITIAGILRNAIKCIWIVFMIAACKSMAEEIIKAYSPSGKAFCIWLVTWALLMSFGLVDIFNSVITAPFSTRDIFMALTYVVFYAAFVAVYYFAEEQKIKAYFLIMFIYLF